MEVSNLLENSQRKTVSAMLEEYARAGGEAMRLEEVAQEQVPRKRQTKEELLMPLQVDLLIGLFDMVLASVCLMNGTWVRSQMPRSGQAMFPEVELSLLQAALKMEKPWSTGLPKAPLAQQQRGHAMRPKGAHVGLWGMRSTGLWLRSAMRNECSALVLGASARSAAA